MSRQRLAPTGVRASLYFSPGVRVGNLVFVSGQTARDPGGEVVGAGSCSEQAEYAFTKVKAVLESAGAEMSDVAKLTTFLVNASDYEAYNEVRKRHFPIDPPASSTVVVLALLSPALLIEIEAIAVIASGPCGAIERSD